MPHAVQNHIDALVPQPLNSQSLKGNRWRSARKILLSKLVDPVIQLNSQTHSIEISRFRQQDLYLRDNVILIIVIRRQILQMYIS